MRSTEILQLIAELDARIYFEKGVPYNMALKKDVISIRGKDGRVVSISVPGGYSNSMLTIVREVFDDFQAARLVEVEVPEDKDGRTVYRLSTAGLIRGHNRATALKAMAEYILNNWKNAARGEASLSEEELEDKHVKIKDLVIDLEALACIPLTEKLPLEKFEEIISSLNTEGVFVPEWQLSVIAEGTAGLAA